MRKVCKGAMYRHFKGAFYYVEDLAEHTETGETYVVYRAQADMKLYVRPVDMFLSKVDTEKYPDAEQEYRFELARELYTY